MSSAEIATSMREAGMRVHERLVPRFAAGPNPPPSRRNLLGSARSDTNDDHEVRAQVASVVEATLGESPAVSRRIAAQWLGSVQWSRARWMAIAASPVAAVIARAEAVDFPEIERLAAYLRRCSGGVVLTAPHMGDYLSALLRLLSKLSERPLYISRRKDGSDLETAAFAKLAGFGVQHRVIRHGRRAGVQLLHAVRRGGVAVLLCDLPARWGRTLPLPVLGHTMHWVVGPARLACMARAQLVPLLVHRDGRRDVCHVSRVLDLSRDGCATGMIAAELARQVDRAIRARPGQWQHWHLVPDMLAGAVDEPV